MNRIQHVSVFFLLLTGCVLASEIQVIGQEAGRLSRVANSESGNGEIRSRGRGTVAGAAAQLSETPDFYDPVIRKIEGFEIAVDPALLEPDRKELTGRVFAALANHLQRVKFILPEDRQRKLMLCKIWLELDNPKIRGMQYHPGRGWLLSKGLDPRLVKHVHIPQARALLDRRQWAKHPYVILHELAHAFHDQVYGFDNREIRAVYEKALKSGKYEKILDHRGKQVRHYGMNNEKEYFAESTEAYLGVNDFYPFVRAELKEFDPDMFRLMEKIWGKIP